MIVLGDVLANVRQLPTLAASALRLATLSRDDRSAESLEQIAELAAALARGGKP